MPFLMASGATDLAAFGMMALIIQDHNFKILNNRVDQDIKHLNDSVGQLEKQVDSLPEMVL